MQIAPVLIGSECQDGLNDILPTLLALMGIALGMLLMERRLPVRLEGPTYFGLSSPTSPTSESKRDFQADQSAIFDKLLDVALNRQAQLGIDERTNGTDYPNQQNLVSDTIDSEVEGMASRSFDHGWYAPMEDPSLDIRRWWSSKMHP